MLTSLKYAQEEIVRITTEQSQDGITNPLSEGQVSVKTLGKRSTYTKGYGGRKTTNSNAMSSEPTTNQDMVALEQKYQKAMADQAKAFQTMLMALATKSGIDPTSIPGLVSSAENEEDDALVREEDDDNA